MAGNKENTRYGGDNLSVGKCMSAYLKRHKMLTLTVFLSIVAAVVAALIPPQILKVIVDDIFQEKNTRKLFYFALIYTGAYVLMGLIELIKEALLVCISQGISTEIRISMLRHINRLTYTEFTKYDSAALEAYFNNDVLAINSLITSGVISIVSDLFKMIGIICTIFIFSVKFGLVVVAVLPVLVIISMVVRKRIFEAHLKSRNLEGNVNHLVYENVENMEALQLYDRGESTKKYEKVLREHFKVSQRAVYYVALFPVIMELLKTIIIVALLLFSGYSGEFLGLSVGGVVATIILVTDLFAPLEALGVELQNIQKSMAGLTRVNEFFKMEQEPLKSLDFTGENLSLKFENVSFSYDKKENVISNFNFTMEGTDKITLKGPSGAGKSTIMKLAYGLLTPTAGRVTIGGCDISLLSEESKRGLFGIVYQEPFFNGESIYEELTLHQPAAEEKVREALNIVGLNRIEDLNKPFCESDYSTGELSLLNIARVIILDCKILFLDEMNARIDPVTAEKIMEIMNHIAKDKMVLSISHYGSLLEDSKIVDIERW